MGIVTRKCDPEGEIMSEEFVRIDSLDGPQYVKLGCISRIGRGSLCHDAFWDIEIETRCLLVTAETARIVLGLLPVFAPIPAEDFEAETTAAA